MEYESSIKMLNKRIFELEGKLKNSNNVVYAQDDKPYKELSEFKMTIERLNKEL